MTDDPSRAVEAAVLAAVAATGEPFDVIEIDPSLAGTAASASACGSARPRSLPRS